MIEAKLETPPAPTQAMIAANPRRDITDVVVHSWDDMQRMALAFSKSKVIPAGLQGKFEDVLVILQTAKELGIGPIQGLNGINIIQGKMSVSPELQLALIRGRCPEAFITITLDEQKLSATVVMARSRDRMQEAVTAHWDMAKAKAMQLSDKDNYRKQPLTMLKWRATGEAAKAAFPDVTKGIYNTVEAEFISSDVPQKGALSLNEIYKAKAEIVVPVVEALPAPPVGKTFENTDHPSQLEIEA